MINKDIKMELPMVLHKVLSKMQKILTLLKQISEKP